MYQEIPIILNFNKNKLIGFIKIDKKYIKYFIENGALSPEFIKKNKKHEYELIAINLTDIDNFYKGHKKLRKDKIINKNYEN